MFKRKDYIYAIYQEKSFSKAAEKMFISQPSLSTLVKKEEEKLSAHLFDRTKSPLGLTEFGKSYIDAVEQVNRLETELRHMLDAQNALDNGTLNIGSNSVYTSYILPAFLAEFAKKFPNITMNLVESTPETLRQKLLSDELDLVLDNTEIIDGSFEKYYFSTEHLLLAVPHEFAEAQQALSFALTYEDILNRKHLEPDQQYASSDLFKNLPFVNMMLGNDTRRRTDRIFEFYGVTPKVLFEFNQLATVFNVASGGVACCIVSDALIQHLNTPVDKVYFYPLPNTVARRDVFFQFKKMKYRTKAVNEFINMCLTK